MIYKLLTRIKDTPEVVPHHQLSESSETYGTKHQYHIFLNVSRFMENSKKLKPYQNKKFPVRLV